MEDKSTIVLKSDSIVLQQVDYCKYLGVLIDSDLTWQQHIDYIYTVRASFIRYVIAYVLKLGKCYTMHLSIRTYCIV